jgi:hypothetical protein
MLKALVYKELRESLWIAAIALAAYLYFVIGEMRLPLLPWMGGTGSAIPFIGDGFLNSFVMVSAALAIGLGLRQSVAESVRGTWLFLLHRPALRWKLVGLKLATGAAVYLLCAAVPILIYAWWAATPCTHASPFDWSMTLPCWQGWISISAVYFAAFLVGMRPARWFGSRLFPLFGAAVLAAILQALPWWWIFGLGGVLALDAWLIAGVLYTARTRNY